MRTGAPGAPELMAALEGALTVQPELSGSFLGRDTRHPQLQGGVVL